MYGRARLRGGKVQEREKDTFYEKIKTFLIFPVFLQGHRRYPLEMNYVLR